MTGTTDHAAASRDDVFAWLHNMQHDDTPEYLSEAADLVMGAYDALAAELAAERQRVRLLRAAVRELIAMGNEATMVLDGEFVSVEDWLRVTFPEVQARHHDRP